MRSIFIDHITPHPNNPRKDLGDLTELAASIKARGILQNLTVVRRAHPKLDLFTCIIGHRRLAAAKLAGLETVPCTVADMTDKEQLATMLTENMQRSDLTLLEQANGFQMMMDLGETTVTLAQKTGLSETTVRHRIKLSEMDQGTLIKKIEGGATLTDLIRLEQVKDIKIRNKVLEALGGYNFNYDLNTVLTAQKADELWPVWQAELNKFAMQVKKPENDFVRAEFYFISKDPVVTPPKDAGEVQYFYCRESNTERVSLYRRRDAQDQQVSTQEAERYRKIEEALAELNEVNERCFRLRMDFVREKAVNAKTLPLITDYLIRCLFYPYEMRFSRYASLESPNETIGKLFGLNGKEYEEGKKALLEQIDQQRKENQGHALLLAAYGLSGDSAGDGYFYGHGKYRFPEKKKNTALDALYVLLEALGYQISDEERLMMSGQHPMMHLEDGEDKEDILSDEALDADEAGLDEEGPDAEEEA